MELTAPTIISIIDQLISIGLVQECGYIPTKRGRKPTMYCLNESFKYIITVDLGQSNMFVGISNLIGDFVDIKDESVDSEKEIITFSKHLAQFIKKMLKDNSIKKDEVAVIVVGNVGVVDENTGAISYAAGNAVWRSEPIKLFLEESFTCPVIVKNDINLSAIGEHIRGVTQDNSSFAFFRFDVGAKAGIMIDDKLYEGHDGAAGEIGFSIISLQTKESVLLDRLEQHITLNNLCANVWDTIVDNGNSPLLSHCKKTNQKVNTRLLGEYYLLDNKVNKLLSEYLIRIGNLIINFIAVLNVPIIVLGGGIVNLGEQFLGNLQKYVDNNCFFAPEIKYSSIKEYSGLIGASSIGVELFLDSINLDSIND